MTSPSSTKNPSYNATLYAKNNGWQRRMNLKALDLLQMAFSPRDTSRLQFLDVGCGTGDFTRDCLLPRCLPCRRIVAVDASEDMLSYARKNCMHTDIKIDFLNICDDVGNFIETYGTFDRVYSFFCLNWVKDQRQAMKNVSRLLAPSGECLLLFPAWSPLKAFWRKMAQLDRWRPFTNIFEEYIPESQDLESDQERLVYLEDIVNGSGLIAKTCELLHMPVTYKNWEECIDMQVALNPAASMIGPVDREILRNAAADEVSLWTSGTNLPPALIYLVHARKSEE